MLLYWWRSNVRRPLFGASTKGAKKGPLAGPKELRNISRSLLGASYSRKIRKRDEEVTSEDRSSEAAKKAPSQAPKLPPKLTGPTICSHCFHKGFHHVSLNLGSMLLFTLVLFEGGLCAVSADLERSNWRNSGGASCQLFRPVRFLINPFPTPT